MPEQLPEQTASADATTDHASPPPAPPAVFGTIGRFELREELGQGAFGKVFRAYDPRLDREVALKVPKFEPDEADLRDRFLREAKAAARLQHPNIVPVFDCGGEEDALFIATEFVQGVTLKHRLEADPPGHHQAAQWVRDLALALEHAHGRGVVHRDVKPANVMIDQHNQPRLMDFGLAKRAAEVAAASVGGSPRDPVLTRHGTVLGTPAYMAPEQARGETDAVGPLSDQYSLGVVLYELLTRSRPFAGEVREVLAKVRDPALRPPLPRHLDRSIPLALEAVTLKALQKDPQQRYASAAELAVDLQRWLKGEPVQAPLLIDGTLLKRCPDCKRASAAHKPTCIYCGADLRAAAPFATEPVPAPAAPEDADEDEATEPEPPRTWRSWLADQFRTTQAGLLFRVALVLAIPALLIYAYLHRRADAIASGSGAEPSFLDAIPLIGQLDGFGRGAVVVVLVIGLFFLLRPRS